MIAMELVRPDAQPTFPSTYYLAGKATRDKWKLVDGLDGGIFLSTDMRISDNNGCMQCQQPAEIVNDFVQTIQKCEQLIAFLNSPDSFGSIAEIAWAAAKGIPCRVFVVDPDQYGGPNYNQHGNSPYCGGGHGCVRSNMEDAYWFVCHMRGVETSWRANERASKRDLWSFVAKNFHIKHINSEYWEKLRLLAIEQAGGRCQLCNLGSNLNVHHRHYKTLGHEAVADVTVLCRPCHEKHHTNTP